MADYKSMYYHLAGRVAGAVEILETTSKMITQTLDDLAENLRHAQQTTEEMFISVEEDDGEADVS